jgi:hypothetical protein
MTSICTAAEQDFDDGPTDCPRCGETLVGRECEVCAPPELRRNGTTGEWM